MREGHQGRGAIGLIAIGLIGMYVVLGWGWRADHMAQLMGFFCASRLCGGVAVEVPSQGAL